MSVKTMVRQAALKVAGYKEVPIGGTIGMTLEGEAKLAIQMGYMPAWYPDDPRHPCPFFWSKGEAREATPEEAADCLKRVKADLERDGLTFAEHGDPDGFLVKWTRRAWAQESAEEGQDELQASAQTVREVGAEA